MRKVLIFDSGWGGELFANYLEEELAIIEVVRVIDWKNGPYCQYNEEVICRLAEESLKRYIGKVEVIVLASYTITVAALEYLRERYPNQKFVGFDLRLSRMLRRTAMNKKVMILATEMVRESLEYGVERQRLDRFEVVEPNCEKWLQKTNEGKISEELIRKELCQAKKVDVVLLYCTNFVEMKDVLERIYGWHVRVLDDFIGVYRATCVALGLHNIS